MSTVPRTLFVLALASACVVADEVLLTRLLSVTTWYTLAFAVLSLAMLGLTSGALIAARAAREALPLGPWVSRQLGSMSLTLVLATFITVIVPVSLAGDLTSFASLLLVTAVNAAPMVAGASIVARIMSETPVAIGSLYAVDLGAAALGALAPLVMLGPLSGPSAMVALALIAGIAGLLTAPQRTFASWGAPAVCLGVILVTQTTPSGLTLHYAKGKPLREDKAPAIEKWNPLSYVAVSPFEEKDHPLMWGPSPVTPRGTYTASYATIDGDAQTPIYAYSDLSELGFLHYDVTAAANVLRPKGTACIIGVGGGRDILTALSFGHDHVLGIEINPAMIDLLHHLEAKSPVLRDLRVETVVGDGRAVLAGSSVRCALLQASLVDTWAATGAGAYAHSEATLYTREAWSIFLRRVEPDGVLTFSRWFAPDRPGETARLVALGMASLFDRGVEHPSEHLAIVASGACATILVSPAPFTHDDLARLDEWAAAKQFTVLFSPTHEADDRILAGILATHDVEDLKTIGWSKGFDTSAPTDDRPFFFQLLGISAWLHPFDSMERLNWVHGFGGGVAHGNVTAMLEMLLIMLAVGIVGAGLLGPTLIEARRSNEPALPGWRAGVYFSLLGGGFMLAEVALVQRMHVVLGHPTYALVVVLASLLVASGVGSWLSAALLRTRRSVSFAACAAGILLMALPHVVIAPLAARTLEASFLVRASWTGGAAALVGLSLGMFFPSGLRFVSRERGTPMALALNGVASVIGGAAAVLVSVLFSISASFAVAGVLYLLVGLVGPIRWAKVA